MNLAETHDLLRLAASFDNRRFDDVTVISWQQVLDDVPFDDAQAGVLRHFRDSAEWLMPVHVRRLAEEIDRERRRARRERLEQAAIEAEAADPTRRDRSPQVQALLDDVLGRIGPGRPEALRRPEWLENDRARERAARAEPNPHYVGPPPTDGWPTHPSAGCTAVNPPTTAPSADPRS